MALVPHTGPRVPTFARQTGRVEREFRQTHQKPPKPENPGVIRKEAVFSYPGHPITAEDSPGYIVLEPEAVITTISGSARTAPDAAATLQVKVNGTLAYTATWDSGAVLMIEEAVNVDIYEYDRISVGFSVSPAALFGVVIQIGYHVIQD